MLGTVHIVDDDSLLRRTLENLFASENITSQSYAGAEAFLQQVQFSYQPGCLLLDLRMPDGMSGLELQQHIAEQYQHWPIIFLSGHGQVHTAVSALKHGAIEFLEKPIHNDELIKVVHNALELSHSLSRCAAMQACLTTQEQRVLTFMEQGISIKITAIELQIAEKTVEFHRANVKSKIDLTQYKALKQQITPSHTLAMYD